MRASATGFVGRRAASGYVLLFLAATATAFYVILPVRAGQVGFDAAASVLYFDRLVQGRHLEGFVGTTPKPLLTVVYGLVYNLFHDWRPISWLAIGVLGSSAVLAAVLVRRFAGLPGAAFAGLAVIGLEALLKDASLSYAVGWAFARLPAGRIGGHPGAAALRLGGSGPGPGRPGPDRSGPDSRPCPGRARRRLDECPNPPPARPGSTAVAGPDRAAGHPDPARPRLAAHGQRPLLRGRAGHRLGRPGPHRTGYLDRADRRARPEAGSVRRAGRPGRRRPVAGTAMGDACRPGGDGPRRGRLPGRAGGPPKSTSRRATSTQSTCRS